MSFVKPVVILFLWLLFILPFPSLAEEYVVEVIILKNEEGNWSIQNWFERPSPSLKSALNMDASNNYQLLPNKHFNRLVQKIISDGKHSILTHFSYKQKVISKNNTKLLKIASDSIRAVPEEIEGFMRFYKSKYYHVEINLQIELPIPSYIPSDKYAWPFYIDSKRKIKLNEPNYFDHPLLGVMIIAKKLKTL